MTTPKLSRLEIARRISTLPESERRAALEAIEVLYAGDASRKWGPNRTEQPNIIQAIYDRQLFGANPVFNKTDTWGRWFVFLNALYGLPLSKHQEKIFCKHTGRTKYAPPKGGYKEAAVITGVQSGKTWIASTIVAYEALTAEPQQDGTNIYALVLAQDFRNATRTIFSYASSPFEVSQVFGRRVKTWNKNDLSLDNGVVLAAYPCRPASIRGLRARVIVLDEFAFYIGSDEAENDLEMLRAARGRVATTEGRVVIISSPYGESGALYELDRNHWGRDDSPVLIFRASAPEMNPTLGKDYLERMKETDPEGYRAEVLGEYRKGISTFFDPETIAKCVTKGVKERAPGQFPYFAFVDPSGGKSDAFTWAIGHKEGDKAVVDLVRGRPSPFSPSDVVEEIVSVLRDYGIDEVEGDKYAGEWPQEQFAQRGVTYTECDVPKSDLYLSTLSAVNSGRAVLPDEPTLLKEMRGLERHRGSAGRDRIDHRPGAHDDFANAGAGVIRTVLQRSQTLGDYEPWGVEKTEEDRAPGFGYDPNEGLQEDGEEDGSGIGSGAKRRRKPRYGY